MSPGQPTCPSCGKRPEPRRVICMACWSLVPLPARRAIDVAWKALRARPTSAELQRDYDLAIAAAVEATR